MPIPASASGYLNELWKNPIWNPLNFMWAVIIGIVSLIAWIIKRERRELGYIRLSDTSVVNVNKSFAEKVKITYLGVSTRTLQLIRLKIINTGNQPIKKDEYEEPLTFVDLKPIKNGSVSGFYTFDFPEKSPKDLNPVQYIYNNRYGIKPLLLNPGDSITIDILNIDVKDSKAVVDVRGRIVGVKKIKKLSSSDMNMISATPLLIGGFIVGVTLILVPFVIGNYFDTLYLVAGMLSIFFGIILSTLVLFNSKWLLNIFLIQKEEAS